jgi:hypothetical protein
MSMIFILFQIKFDNDIKNDKLLGNHIGTQEKKRKVDCHW